MVSTWKPFAAVKAPSNWLCEPGRNPFNLQPPPESFLRELAVFDPDIVIFPSATEYGYWLTRRRRHTAGISTVLNTDKDSAIMARHGLIPVACFGGHLTWGSHVLQWLSDRDLWKHGGAKKAVEGIEERENALEVAAQKALTAENQARARSMWRTYHTRAGSRLSLNDINRGRKGISRTSRTLFSRPYNSSPSRTGSAPVPPTGWTSQSSGLLTPPTP